MPRKSAAETALNVTGTQAYIEPRSGFSAPLTRLFREIVRSARAEHFVPSDRPLLERYCEAIALAETAQKHLDRDGAVTELGRLSAWVTVQEKAHRTCNALAGRLRLCPQARLDRKVAGTTTRRPKRAAPWED